jgi:hypothetical protein
MTVTGNTATTADGAALAMNLTRSAGTATMLFSNNTFNNNSATVRTADIGDTGTLTFNGTFSGNTFNNGGSGDNFQVQTNASGALAQLYLTGNTASGGTSKYDLTNTSGTLTVFGGTASTDAGNSPVSAFNFTNVTSGIQPPTPPP